MALYSQEQTPSLLLELASNLRECQPEEQKIDYNFATWERCFAQDNNLLEIQKRFGESISRRDVLDISKEAQADTARLRQFAMAAMIWADTNERDAGTPTSSSTTCTRYRIGEVR